LAFASAWVRASVHGRTRHVYLGQPFNALDKKSVTDVHNLLQVLRAQGKTVLLASRSATDIEKTCDVVYGIEEGRMVKQS
jgi:ABC-type multidrug transport system ATPase subunit